MAREVKGGLIQASVALDGAESPARHREAMIEKHLPLIEEAASRGVQLLCLQEMFTGPYFAAEQDNRWIEIAESIPEGPTVALMRELAERHGMVIVVPQNIVTDVGRTTAVVAQYEHRIVQQANTGRSFASTLWLIHKFHVAQGKHPRREITHYRTGLPAVWPPELAGSGGKPLNLHDSLNQQVQV